MQHCNIATVHTYVSKRELDVLIYCESAYFTNDRQPDGGGRFGSLDTNTTKMLYPSIDTVYLL
ncbi:hypothetical protein I7I50_03190 [Histoplasma capsulatum G186AR]|uniref:Uncharacterized protein n=1 Tax=Ajellomyces capsulatus TaxID=5037 RepID=A0A8H8D5I2_AJECA|nr:hypothetical protein I7I52_00141 [Histoplasma capsulatum]QSS72124.1 hypothetical protein I7I50_03190 [Histoplasma capsulatum G186AR]